MSKHKPKNLIWTLYICNLAFKKKTFLQKFWAAAWAYAWTFIKHKVQILGLVLMIVKNCNA